MCSWIIHILNGVITGAEWITWGVGKGAEATGHLINYGKDKLKQNLTTDEKPAKIDDKYHTGAEYAQKASVVAVKVKTSSTISHLRVKFESHKLSPKFQFPHQTIETVTMSHDSRQAFV